MNAAKKYQVMTPDGWSDFSGLRKKVIPEYIKITTNLGKSLKSSLNHPIMTVDGFKEVKHIKVNDTICTDDGFEVIVDIEIINKAVIVYDLLNVKLDNCYFTNGILSHNCVEFLGSSGTLISGSKLKQIFKDIEEPKYSNEHGLRVWESAESDKIYSVTVDVSRGKGLDYSAFQVIDITEAPYKQVATFRNNLITPPDYANFLYSTAKGYNEAYVLIEVNDIGGQVADILALDYGYENIIYTESAGAKGRRVATGFGGNTIDRGIRTTKTTKSLGCSMLKLLVEQDTLKLRCSETINELSVFSKSKDSYEAEQGFNDDLTMGLVLFSWLAADPYFKHINDSDVMHSLRDLTDEQIYESLMPFGIVSGGLNNYEEEETEVFDGDVWLKLNDIDSMDNFGNYW